MRQDGKTTEQEGMAEITFLIGNYKIISGRLAPFRSYLQQTHSSFLEKVKKLLNNVIKPRALIYNGLNTFAFLN